MSGVESSCVVCDVCRVCCDLYRFWCVASSAMFVHRVVNLFRVFEREFVNVCFNDRFHAIDNIVDVFCERGLFLLTCAMWCITRLFASVSGHLICSCCSFVRLLTLIILGAVV